MNSFNSYKIGLDLKFLKEYCIVHGKLVKMKRGDVFEEIGNPSRLLGYVVKGCFKYVVLNSVEKKEYITGFVFENEFLADYPNCLYGQKSEVRIVSMMTCEVYIVEAKYLNDVYEQGVDEMRTGKSICENLFLQTYNRFLDFYRKDARSRYESLLFRCPHIVQDLSLKDIASFLRVTPKTISQIRKDILLG